MIRFDTIVALSTAPGPAARAIVRVSGSDAVEIAASVSEIPSAAGTFRRGVFHIQNWNVAGTLYLFRAPKSYTGEDLIEFHLPGNPLLCDRLIEACVARGARRAEPGEFTARAFFNGKMDLTQAEGVAATIAALNQRQLDAARQLMAGELAHRIGPVMELVAETLALVEAGIDFVDEDIHFISHDDLDNRLKRADTILADLVDQSTRFGPIGSEPTVALIGRPNVGKSTLLNALAQTERAIVSPIAGTTRDALSVNIALPHGIVKIIDIAGIEESNALNEIDQQMQAQARRTAASADLLISLRESQDCRPPVDVGRRADICVRTKTDLGGNLSSDEIGVCAPTGAGLEKLRQTLDERAFGNGGAGATLNLNARHLHAISETRAALSRASNDLAAGHEWIALHLRESLHHLGQITGTISPDELLGKIFSKFCIGK